MIRAKRSATYLKFGLYLLVVILVNVAGITLFARFDLTRDGIFSLSGASQRAVSTLSEPLTLHVFFSRNLPPPYNSIEQYLRDLLEEYALRANRWLSYRFYDVSAEQSDGAADSGENQKLANSYGIHPIQVQAIEKDEVKFQRAYMGMALIHGDLIERIPTITTTDGLEYQITSALQKMNAKISALLRLTGKIQVRLFLSPSLKAIAPLMGLKQLPELPVEIEQTVKELNAKTYGKLAYEFSEPPAGPEFEEVSRSHNLLALSWPASNDGKIAAGQGAIGLVVQYGERKITLPLIDVVRIPIIGTQYKLLGREDLDRMISASVEALIDIHTQLGFLADRGSAPIGGAGPGGAGRPEELQAFGNVRELISRNYSLKPVSLAEGRIPEGIACLLIAKPREKFSEYDLFLIDQFLMQGKSLALFLDAFDEIQMPGQAAYTPIESGLEALLEHFGVRIQHSYVLDENCYRQELPAQLGGGERPIYYAPLIKSQFIDQDREFMRNIKGLVAVKASPLELLSERVSASNLKAWRLLASSEKSWEMKPPINLNPLTLRPPPRSEEVHSRPLAYLLEGAFPSFFAGKPLPVRTVENKTEGETPAPAPLSVDPGRIEHKDPFIATGKPGRIFVMATTEMLKDVVIDETGRGPNAVFALNVLDYLNGREDIAVMRAKEQRFNPLHDVSAGAKTFIKWFAIAGLPLLVALFGIGVWFRRSARKRRIQEMFASPA